MHDGVTKQSQSDFPPLSTFALVHQSPSGPSSARFFRTAAWMSAFGACGGSVKPTSSPSRMLRSFMTGNAKETKKVVMDRRVAKAATKNTTENPLYLST